jgi:hypothetical protein
MSSNKKNGKKKKPTTRRKDAAQEVVGRTWPDIVWGLRDLPLLYKLLVGGVLFLAFVAWVAPGFSLTVNLSHHQPPSQPAQPAGHAGIHPLQVHLDHPSGR